ncbi:hypothetical protein Ddye_009508 [Dipteronia dyeriana]|uniref:DOG1 domain-containing protein n=1 Tax=Dipteronia dyeriana TaxID=168575 RepID=A0AAE0CMD3_9ROSI|nr:hypothetical protein Ddye_009508 [Dipteronia dyeriana]
MASNGPMTIANNNNNNNNNNSDDNAASLESFFVGWIQRQEQFLDQLISAQADDCEDSEREDLITRVLAHYQQYYEEKSRFGRRNIFMLFNPPWFTPFELAFFWIAGFNPDLAFRLVSDSIRDLTEEQSQSIERLRGEIRMEEKMLNDDMARIQERVAAPPIMEMARRFGRMREVDIVDDVSVNDGVRSEMEVLVANADSLRTSTAAKLVEILSPSQKVRFLTAATKLQLRIRNWGLERERNKNETTE